MDNERYILQKQNERNAKRAGKQQEGAPNESNGDRNIEQHDKPLTQNGAPYARTYVRAYVLYIPYRTHTYVRIVSPTYVRTYVSTYGTYVRTYSFSHVRTCGPCFIYVRTSLHASEPTATALPSPSTF